MFKVTQLVSEVRFEPNDTHQATQLVDSTMGVIKMFRSESWKIFQFYQMCHLPPINLPKNPFSIMLRSWFGGAQSLMPGRIELCFL